MSTPASSRPFVGLSLMTEDDFRRAAYPLFEAGEVEVLEWSFDMGWGPNGAPEWTLALLDLYSEANRLLGHGVTFSPLSANWSPRQQWWLENFRREVETRRYRHISEHFGFCAGGSFHQSAPLPVPLTPTSLRVGREHLRLLTEIAPVPVGLENLAFAFHLRDVREQDAFLEQLLAPTDGFVLLDLHNIYCQMCNFDLSARELLESYPLHRVRELHVSGGSWSESSDEPSTPIRRDTHDDAVPDALWPLLGMALELCPHVEAVIFERLGGTIADDEDAERFRADFRRLRAAVAESCHVEAA